MKRKLKIQITGDIAKNNSLPLDYFISLAKNLQELITQIVIHDVPSKETIDLKNFKLELIDFEKGSAIPVFQYIDDGQDNLITSIEKQREIVDKKLNDLLEISSQNNYLSLLNKYPEPLRRNAITKPLYNFVHNLKGGIATIYLNGDEGYRIHEFNKETKDILLKDIIEEADSEEPETQLAKVKVYKAKERKKRKIIEMYDKKLNSIDYSTENIKTNKYYYELKFPLRNKSSIVEGMITIENEMIGIYAYGETLDEAENMFNLEFDFIYKRYNALNDAQLTDDVKTIKMIINNIVKKHGELES